MAQTIVGALLGCSSLLSVLASYSGGSELFVHDAEVASVAMLQRSALSFNMMPSQEDLLDVHEWSKRLRSSIPSSFIKIKEYTGPGCPKNSSGGEYTFFEKMCVADWSFECACKKGEKGIQLIHHPDGCNASGIEIEWIPLYECIGHKATASDPTLYFSLDDGGSCPTSDAQCTVYGDPHISVFDQRDIALLVSFGSLARSSPSGIAEESGGHFGVGDYWLVKSELISVQARYTKVFYPKAIFQNRSYLTRVAIGGPFLHGHVLVIGPRDTGKIELLKPNGVVYELMSDTNEFDLGDLIRMRATDYALMVKDNSQRTPGIYITLPGDVKLNVNRFGQHIDFSINMDPEAAGTQGIDGQCGNFNGDPLDDSAEQIMQRIGHQIPETELLFTRVESSRQYTEEEQSKEADVGYLMGTARRTPDTRASGAEPYATFYLYEDESCSKPFKIANHTPFFKFSADITHCSLGWNLTCGCNGTEKIIQAARYHGGCLNASSIDVYDISPGVCHDPSDPIDASYWKVDAGECPTCECTDASCIIHGDPHVTVFDQLLVSFIGADRQPASPISLEGNGMRTSVGDVDDMFGWGNYWLVKSEMVSIQAKYRKVYYPQSLQPLNHTYLTAVAIGGSFLEGNKFIIEPRNGHVSWISTAGENSLILEEEDSIFDLDNIAQARYHTRLAVRPGSTEETLGIDMELPRGVKLRIDRLGKHLNLEIKMPSSAGGSGGVDGQCGNFNGDPSDDTAELINERMGAQVPQDQLLFELDAIGDKPF